MLGVIFRDSGMVGLRKVRKIKGPVKEESSVSAAVMSKRQTLRNMGAVRGRGRGNAP